MKRLEDFSNYFQPLVLEELRRRLGGLGEIFDICSYTFSTGGKFFRPFLLSEVAAFLNKDVDFNKIFPFCLAIELIHNYSLIHDDLPSMDNADYRRGHLTVHKKFGEAEAVLAGDMLLTIAFEVLSEGKDFEERKIIKIIKKVAQYSSYRYLITGQYLDIWLQKGKVEKNVDNIRLINFYKTAGLILLSVEIPIILFDPSYSIKFSLIKYGYFLGLLFQITDDILDNDGLAKVMSVDELKNLASSIFMKIGRLSLDERLLSIAEYIYRRDK